MKSCTLQPELFNSKFGNLVLVMCVCKVHLHSPKLKFCVSDVKKVFCCMGTNLQKFSFFVHKKENLIKILKTVRDKYRKILKQSIIRNL